MKSLPARETLLIIAMCLPVQKVISKMWKLRDGPGAELKSVPEWSYPCAIEASGSLWVVCTSEERHGVLSRIPVSSLAAD